MTNESKPKQIDEGSLVGQNLDQDSTIKNDEGSDLKFLLFVLLLLLLAFAGFAEMKFSESCDDVTLTCDAP